MSRIVNRLSVIALCLLVLSASARAQTNLTTAKARTAANPLNAPAESDRMRDGLVGPVRRVRTEVAKLSSADGRPVESKHVMLEIASYDVKGNKVENQYFPIAGATLTGKEVYKYDDKGNISEMTLLNSDGSLLSRESYKYEYDFAGNWNKMTTSVAVVDGGRLTFEPTEITYRSIMYYLDENMVKMVTPAATTTAQPTSPVAGSNVTNPVQSNTSRGTKLSANRKTSPVLPASSVTGTSLSGPGPVEIKTTGVSENQDVLIVALDSEPPPSPGPRPLLKPVSGGVLNGTAISLPPPLYPETAKRMRTAGVVAVEVVLDEIGKVVSAIAVSGPSVLRDAAVQAALKARFSPTKLSGQPVKVSGVINYKFALAQ